MHHKTQRILISRACRSSIKPEIGKVLRGFVKNTVTRNAIIYDQNDIWKRNTDSEGLFHRIIKSFWKGTTQHKDLFEKLRKLRYSNNPEYLLGTNGLYTNRKWIGQVNTNRKEYKARVGLLNGFFFNSYSEAIIRGLGNLKEFIVTRHNLNSTRHRTDSRHVKKKAWTPRQ